MKKELPEYIQLASSHITQHTSNGAKSDWSIEENMTNDKLGTLPKHLSEKEVFAIIDFAREYELRAFNSGIRFQKGKENEFLLAQIKELKEYNKVLAGDNDRLATALDKMTKG